MAGVFKDALIHIQSHVTNRAQKQASEDLSLLVTFSLATFS